MRENKLGKRIAFIIASDRLCDLDLSFDMGNFYLV